MAPNPWRGEVGITLDGNSYVMRPTFEALSHIEQILGTGLVALARKLSSGELNLQEMAVIVECCIYTSAGSAPSACTIQDALLRGGLKGGLEAIAAMFALVFGGLQNESD